MKPSETALPEPTPQPWWRHGVMWLVVGGPLLVVAASIVTAVIAYRGAEPVLREPAAAARPHVRPDAQSPALQARNHAATGAAPAAASANTK